MAATVAEESQARLNRLSGIGAGASRHADTFNYPVLATQRVDIHQRTGTGSSVTTVVPAAQNTPS
jgi:hypothetical protein